MKSVCKNIVYFFTLLATSATLIGCGGKGKSDSEGGVVEITFAGRSNESEEDNFTTFISNFMEDNPDIKVSIEWYSNESAYNNALKGRLNNLPDLFMLSDDQFIPYVEGGFLKDYKDLVDMDELKGQIWETLADSFCYNPKTDSFGYEKDNPDCGFYGYPKGPGTYSLIYNKSMFIQYMESYNKGLPTTQQMTLPSYEHPMTFDEFKQVNLNLIQGRNKLGLSGAFYPCAGYDMDSAVFSNNANYFDETASHQKIDTPNFIQAISFLASLYQEEIVAPYGGTSGTGEVAFLNGKSIFYFMGPWKCKDYWNQISSFEWDICPVCVGPAEGALSKAYIGGMGYVMSNKISDSKKVAAARLAKYLATNEDSQRLQYKRGQSVPLLKSLSEEYIKDTKGLLANRSPEGRQVWIDNADGYGTKKIDRHGEEYIDNMTLSFRPGRYTYNSTWKTDLKNWFDGKGANNKSVWKGEISAQKACEEFAKTLQTTLEEMKEMQEF